MATVPTIDDVTADAIRRALSAAAAGQIDRALRDGVSQLERVVGALPMLSYPHGSADGRVAAAARDPVV